MRMDNLGYYALYLAIVKDYTQKEAFAALGDPVERVDRRRNHHKKQPEPFHQMSIEDVMRERA